MRAGMFSLVRRHIVPLGVFLCMLGASQLAVGKGKRTPADVLCERAAACNCLPADCQKQLAQVDNMDWAVCVAGATCEEACDDDQLVPRINACTEKHGGPVLPNFVCDASGSYEVCSRSDGICRVYPVTNMGMGVTELAAGVDASGRCSTHMTNMIISNNMNHEAHVKQSCRATSCKRIAGR
jgi:hypothetical protein